MANPLVPAVYDVVWTLVAVALLAAVVAIVAALVVRSRHRRDEARALRADVDSLKARRDIEGPAT